jgi:hypothetical protein
MKFNLPEEKEEFEIYFKAFRYYNIIIRVREYLRNKIKYENLSSKEQAIYEKIRKDFYNICSEEIDEEIC